MNRNKKSIAQLLLFSGPAIAIFALFLVYPLVATVVKSFEGAQGGFSLDQYTKLFSNTPESFQLWNALGNTFEFFLVAVIIQIPVALGLAALLTSRAVRRTRGLYRTLIFLPTTLSVVIVGFIWSLLLNPLWGVSTFPLLGNASTALPTLAAIWSWAFVGVPTIFIYSALISIPADVIDAASMDGAGGVRVFWSVKLPMIRAQLGLILILTFIWSFRMFDLIFAVKGGRPGPDYSTDLLATMFYRTFFGWRGQLGDPALGAAIAVIVLAITALFVGLYFVLFQRKMKVEAY